MDGTPYISTDFNSVFPGSYASVSQGVHQCGGKRRRQKQRRSNKQRKNRNQNKSRKQRRNNKQNKSRKQRKSNKKRNN